MLISRTPRCRRGQWSLIGTLIAVAILVVLAALYLPRMLGTGGTTGAQQSAITQANGTACTIYLSEFNSAVLEYKQDHGGQVPTNLQELKPYGVTDSMIQSPGCSFQINPQTGNVTNSPAAGAGQAGASAPGGITIPPGTGSGM